MDEQTVTIDAPEKDGLPAAKVKDRHALWTTVYRYRAFGGLMESEPTDHGLYATISDDYADFTPGQNGTFTFMLQWEEALEIAVLAIREFGWLHLLKQSWRRRAGRKEVTS